MMACEHIKVENVLDFIRFLRCLERDWEERGDTTFWSNPSLPGFLDGMARLLEDTTIGDREEIIQRQPTWAEFADLLRGAATYD